MEPIVNPLRRAAGEPSEGLGRARAIGVAVSGALHGLFVILVILATSQAGPTAQTPAIIPVTMISLPAPSIQHTKAVAAPAPRTPPTTPHASTPAQKTAMRAAPIVRALRHHHPRPVPPKREAAIECAPPPSVIGSRLPQPRPIAPATQSPAIPPQPLTGDGVNPQPTYPSASRRRHEQGRVVIRLTISIDGTVTQAGIAHSSGFALLDESALKTVSHWRFRPAGRDGHPVEATTTVAIEFELEDE